MSKYDVQNLKVVLGDHNLKQQGETRGDVIEYSVKRVIRHKHFDSNKLVSSVCCTVYIRNTLEWTVVSILVQRHRYPDP
jgi:hypothetical protein